MKLSTDTDSDTDTKPWSLDKFIIEILLLWYIASYLKYHGNCSVWLISVQLSFKICLNMINIIVDYYLR